MELSQKFDSDKSIVILYIKSFKWKNSMSAKLLGGHPLSGRVYRALKLDDHNVYYINISGDHIKENNEIVNAIGIIDGVRISELVGENSEWECDIVEVTENNITDLAIDSEDYKKISTWLQQNHSDFVEKLKSRGGIDAVTPKSSPTLSYEETIPNIKAEVEKRLKQIDHKLSLTCDEAVNAIRFISMRDPWMLNSILSILNFVSSVIKQEDNHPIIPFSREIAVSNEFGKGANLYSSLYNLESYLQDSNETNIHKAVYNLLLELIRLQTSKQ